MPIVPSRSRDIETLLGRLGSDDVVARESAVARLTLLGERCVDRLLAFTETAGPTAVVDALAVLGRLRPPRALGQVATLCNHPDSDVATRACRTCGAFEDPRAVAVLAKVARTAPDRVRLAAVDGLAAAFGRGSNEAFEPLVALVLSEQQPEALRLRALEALSSLPAAELGVLLTPLRATGRPALARRAAELGLAGATSPASVDTPRTSPATDEMGDLRHIGALGRGAGRLLLQQVRRDALEPERALRLGRALTELGPEVLPAAYEALGECESPVGVRLLADVLSAHPAGASVPVLDGTLRRLATSRSRLADPAWAEARARLHLALATLQSRIALYDLADLLTARPVLAAPSLLKAAELVGDGSLVAPLAALASDAPETRDLCLAALAAIVRRERLRRTSKVVRALRPDHAAAIATLWPAPRRARA